MDIFVYLKIFNGTFVSDNLNLSPAKISQQVLTLNSKPKNYLIQYLHYSRIANSCNSMVTQTSNSSNSSATFLLSTVELKLSESLREIHVLLKHQ